MDNHVLNAVDLSKTIKKKDIVKNINIQLEECEILGFLGPNGSGKSTTY